MTRIAIGVGCRLGCSADAIAGLVRRALALAPTREGIDSLSSWPGLTRPSRPGLCETGLSRTVLDGMAGSRAAMTVEQQSDALTVDMTPASVSLELFTIADKCREPGLIAAATRLGLGLVFLPREALCAQPVHTPSPHAQARFGVPSVAEAAALAGAGPGAVLLVQRIAEAGATCAIAAAPA